MKRKAKIIFFGTPNFAIPTLKSLINSKYSVLAVVTTNLKGEEIKLNTPQLKILQFQAELKFFNQKILIKRNFIPN